MRLCWQSPELLALCQSKDGLIRRWPQHGKDAQLLLTMVANAASLFDLGRLQCVAVRVAGPSSPGDAFGISVQYAEIRLRGTLVNVHGSPLLVRPAGDTAGWTRQVDCLRVGTISIARQMMKATG